VKQLIENRIYLIGGHPTLFKKNTAYQPMAVVGDVGFDLLQQGRFGLFGGYVSLSNRYRGETRTVLNGRYSFLNRVAARLQPETALFKVVFSLL
jgi:hypothetical protein